LSFRGIDNQAYYRLADDPRYYIDYTGCGNSLDLSHPHVLKMVTDSLRYWVKEMHVDGFRFDLATTLARRDGHFNTHSNFLTSIEQDPLLSRVKLIAEPWDLGPEGYHIGDFPAGWSEWNDRFRDGVRRFWRGDGAIPDMATRITGSSDVFDRRGRRPRASLNFVTAHDGFTLRDLVSYDRKHNEANLDDNRDGTNDNYSWNCGVEGPTQDRHILGLRAKQRRNFLATLLLSQGIPMLVAGDELGHTQLGNNNAYCQDNDISWLDWSMLREAQHDNDKREAQDVLRQGQDDNTGAQDDNTSGQSDNGAGQDEMGRAEDDVGAESLVDFTREVIALRRAHPVFRRPRFFRGIATPASPLKDITWFAPEGHEMSEHDWNDRGRRCFGALLGGDVGDRFISLHGYPELDDSFLLVLNAHDWSIEFRLPSVPGVRRWAALIDTARPEEAKRHLTLVPGSRFAIADRSLALFVGRLNE
jgi:glycogen operon protein